MYNFTSSLTEIETQEEIDRVETQEINIVMRKEVPQGGTKIFNH